MISRRRRTSDAPPPVSRKLANVVIDRRGELGLTQVSLAEKAGISHRTVQNIEEGKYRPQPLTLAAVARVLGIETSALRELADEDRAAKAAS